MLTFEPFLVAAVGVVAGAISSATGSGTLVMYPALLGAGLSPVSANATNSIGLIPGNLSGAWHYRHHAAAVPRGRLLRWLVATGIGALIGALLVVVLPPTVFAMAIPWLILTAVVLFAFEPWYMPRIAHLRNPRAVVPSIGAVGIYGGYFGGGQGLAYLLVLTALTENGLQLANAVKNQTMAVANSAATIVFISFGEVTWWAAGCTAAGSVLGGWGGARVASRLPDWLLRSIIVLAGALGFVVAVRGA